MQNRLEKIKQNIETACQNSRSDQLCRDTEFLVTEIERLYKILHDLTPGGSEYCYDADRYAESIRERIATSERIAKQTIRNSRSGWKPIEGAPEGEEVIVFDPELGCKKAYCTPYGEWAYRVSGAAEYITLDPTHYIEEPIVYSQEERRKHRKGDRGYLKASVSGLMGAVNGGNNGNYCTIVEVMDNDLLIILDLSSDAVGQDALKDYGYPKDKGFLLIHSSQFTNQKP